MARLTIASLALGAAFLVALTAPAQACGTPDSICTVASGEYRLAMPENRGGTVPAVVFLHGWGGSARGTMRNRAMMKLLSARGYALIAPEGLPGHGNHGGKQKNWSVRDGATYKRDDIAFLREVLADAATHGVDTDRVLLAGFSRGASMVWDVACHAPDLARAYAPVSGAFWLPLPKGCAGPVDLFHTHGWADRVVPLEGRSVAGGRLTQGDTFASLAILRAALGCRQRMPDRTETLPGTILLRHWESCKSGRIDLMLHPGGHRVPKGWLPRALDWFEARLAEDAT